MTGVPVQASNPGIERVSALELFFDLVFVFAVTQLTQLVAHPRGSADYVQAALAFGVLMWIYDGFAWLTSNVRIESNAEYWLMLAAMTSFLVMGMAVPRLDAEGGVPFGLGLLAAVIVHACLFRKAATGRPGGLRSVFVYNALMAVLVIVAGATPPPVRWVAWGGAFALPVVLTLRRREATFTVSPKHFVERHGLLVIIALGESVIGLGLGTRQRPLVPAVVGYAVLGLYLTACIWASYFDDGDEPAERALAQAAPSERSRLALMGFGWAHFPMLAGIMLTAAGLESGILHPIQTAEPAAAGNLAAGLSLYLLGDIAFRSVIGLASGAIRWVAVTGTALSVMVGLTAPAIVHLGVCAGFCTLIWVWPPRERTEAA